MPQPSHLSQEKVFFLPLFQYVVAHVQLQQ